MGEMVICKTQTGNLINNIDCTLQGHDAVGSQKGG
jgi:hypothetical protein